MARRSEHPAYHAVRNIKASFVEYSTDGTGIVRPAALDYRTPRNPWLSPRVGTDGSRSTYSLSSLPAAYEACPNGGPRAVDAGNLPAYALRQVRSIANRILFAHSPVVHRECGFVLRRFKLRLKRPTE
jgi:hypothetical protein